MQKYLKYGLQFRTVPFQTKAQLEARESHNFSNELFLVDLSPTYISELNVHLFPHLNVCLKREEDV